MKIKCPDCGEIFEFSPDVVYNGPDTGKSGNANNMTNNAATTPAPVNNAPISPIPANNATVSKTPTNNMGNPVDSAIANMVDSNFATLLGTTHTAPAKAPTVNMVAPPAPMTTDVNANVNADNNADDDSDDSDDDDASATTQTAPANVITHSSGFVLTADNYYSDAANQIYMSNSLFKGIYGSPTHPIACPDAAINGPKPESEALLIGGYVDSYFEGQASFDAFKTDHEAQLMMKSGKDYLKFVKDADAAIEKVKKSQIFMDYAAKGDHQSIMVGTIAGQDFKIKMDAYHPNDKIVDVKYIKSADLVYNEVKKEKITFIEDYGYDIQGAIYQEIVYQNTGKRLPFYIAYITKEPEPDFDIVEIPQNMLDAALEYVKMKLTVTPYTNIKAAPASCGRKKCKWCLSKKQITAPKKFDEFVKYCS